MVKRKIRGLVGRLCLCLAVAVAVVVHVVPGVLKALACDLVVGGRYECGSVATENKKKN